MRRERVSELKRGLAALGIAVAVVAPAACSGDDEASTSTGPTTTLISPIVPVSTTEPPLRAAGPMPTAESGAPLLSPVESYPVLTVDQDVPIALAPADPASSGDHEPRVRFADDGSVEVLDMVALTANAYGVEGQVRWSVPLPADVEGRHPVSMKMGPDSVLYVAYLNDVDRTLALAAVATSGERGGQVLGTWPTEWICAEGACGDFVLGPSGIPISTDGTRVASYVDRLGQATGLTSTEPPRPLQESAPGPAMPGTWTVADAAGATLSSWRTTVQLEARSWSFEAMGVRFVEGSYATFTAENDGSVVSTVLVTSDANQPGLLLWLDLLPDGSVSASAFPPGLTDVLAARIVDGQRFAIVRDTNGLRVLRLVTA